MERASRRGPGRGNDLIARARDGELDDDELRDRLCELNLTLEEIEVMVEETLLVLETV